MKRQRKRKTGKDDFKKEKLALICGGVGLTFVVGFTIIGFNLADKNKVTSEEVRQERLKYEQQKEEENEKKKNEKTELVVGPKDRVIPENVQVTNFDNLLKNTYLNENYQDAVKDINEFSQKYNLTLEEELAAKEICTIAELEQGLEKYKKDHKYYTKRQLTEYFEQRIIDITTPELYVKWYFSFPSYVQQTYFYEYDGLVMDCLSVNGNDANFELEGIDTLEETDEKFVELRGLVETFHTDSEIGEMYKAKFKYKGVAYNFYFYTDRFLYTTYPLRIELQNANDTPNISTQRIILKYMGKE